MQLLVRDDPRRSTAALRGLVGRALLGTGLALSGLALLCVPFALADETRTFQQGVGGYSGSQDLHLAIPADFTGNGHGGSQFVSDPDNPHWVWDFEGIWGEGSVRDGSSAIALGYGDHIGLLRFADLFGDQPWQLPPGAEIVSATLTLRPFNDPYSSSRNPGDAANLHLVRTSWDETVRWDSFGPTPGPDAGIDYDSQILLNTGRTGSDLSLDVTSSLAAWSADPASNHGWMFMPSSTQDIISPSGSALSNVTGVTVDLKIDTPSRGDLIATLRHGDYTALLINRILSACVHQSGTAADDLDINLDDDAAEDVHFSGTDQPLTGTWKPDAACFSLPLCTGSGTGGLCGQPADGDWVLTVTDAWSNSPSPVRVESWGLHLSDGINPDESYGSSPALTVPQRHSGSAFASTIWSGEADDPLLRPELTVVYRETPVFSPSELVVFPSSGSQYVSLRIPDGSNASAPVTVTVTSGAGSVVGAPGSPLVFAQGAPTSQLLELSIGAAGSELLVATNDAGLGEARLPVTVAAVPISLDPGALYRVAGSPDEIVEVTIPLGSNAGAPVDLTLSSDDVAVVQPLGAVGGALAMSFAAGASNTQTVTLQLGGAAGSAILTASDDASVLSSTAMTVGLSVDEPIEFDVTIAPYVQLGNAALGAATDQFVLAWETIARSEFGANADRFTVEYRRVGDPSWIVHPLSAAVLHGSTSRVLQNTVVSGLDFDESYEYRITHLRNESAIASYQDVVPTRKSGAFRFTAFGNSGSDATSQQPIADLLLTLASDIHLLLGDNVYYYGEYEHYKPRVAEAYGSFMSTRPMHFAMGNHDDGTDQGQPARSFFFVPENGPAELPSELNYSFDYGDVHFVSILSIAEVASWLSADLAASSKPWKVVYTHEPPVTRDPYGTDRQESAIVRDELLKVAVEQGVDLFLSGAVHSMQRYLPITAVVQDDPYVEWAKCSAGFGTTLVYPGSGAWARASPGPIPDVLDPPMELYAPELGIAVVDVDADQMVVSLLDEFGVALDSVTLSHCIPPDDCSCDDTLWLYGVSSNGYVEIEIAGVTIHLPTHWGQSAEFVLSALVAAINADPTLSGLGVSATQTNNRITTFGAVMDAVEIADLGLSEAPIVIEGVPSLSTRGLATLIIVMLSASALGLLRRRTRLAAEL